MAFGFLIGALQGLMLAVGLLGIPRFSNAVRKDLEKVHKTPLIVTEVVISVCRFLYLFLMMVVVAIVSLDFLADSDPGIRLTVARYWAGGFLIGIVLLGFLTAFEKKTRSTEKR